MHINKCRHVSVCRKFHYEHELAGALRFYLVKEIVSAAKNIKEADVILLLLNLHQQGSLHFQRYFPAQRQSLGDRGERRSSCGRRKF